ncbi:AtpZ/AtpI family protein [Kineococcus indalonis]|uniref:AtpZ/AtpI family protein n=1 Tax=Kineococcus indalonis TaxID=2696566 RepID=UPI00196A3560|nr:AtpZ/AtpI family protein [Kineococcus indalonis]
MPEEDRRPDEDAREQARLQDSVAWNAVSYLMSGIVGFGLLGLLLDRWLGTSFLAVVGCLGGMALSIYYVWFRYGSRK